MDATAEGAGLSIRRELEDGVIELTCELPHDDADPRWDPYLDAAALRERSADVVSLRHVFQPASVAVVGASRRMGTAGRAILHNIVTAGYQGRVYAVNPHAAHMEAVPCVPSVAALPEPVDLAVVAVPPAAVCAVADKCGRRGIKALVVITVGLDPPQGADLLAICRRYGMRLVGPGCFGIGVPQHRPGRDLRRPAPGTGHRGPGHAVRRARRRARRPAVPARRGRLLLRLRRQQVRRLQQRHADVVGTGPGDQTRRAVHRIVRQPPQVRPHRAPGRPDAARADRTRGTIRYRSAGGRIADRRGSHAADHPGGPLPAGRHHRDRQPR